MYDGILVRPHKNSDLGPVLKCCELDGVDYYPSVPEKMNPDEIKEECGFLFDPSRLFILQDINMGFMGFIYAEKVKKKNMNVEFRISLCDNARSNKYPPALEAAFDFFLNEWNFHKASCYCYEFEKRKQNALENMRAACVATLPDEIFINGNFFAMYIYTLFSNTFRLTHS
ncbi:hypothetical protein HY605_03440 [Candidatus Peregrinibacteria bacterium]|nr:hypothetical protein [Candidatus Peregrinibacteria bacterium]